MKKNTFKPGDIVVNKTDSTDIIEVMLVPGMSKYDSCGFYNTDKGFVSKGGSWRWAKDYKLSKKQKSPSLSFKISPLTMPPIPSGGIYPIGVGAGVIMSTGTGTGTKFNIGDRVRVIDNFSGVNCAGYEGTIIYLGYNVGVEFDIKLPDNRGHSLNGKITSDRGWYGLAGELELIESNTNMTKFKIGDKVKFMRS